MMRSLNEAEVKDILRNREEKIENIHRKMLSLYQDLENTEDVLTTAAFPSMELHGMPGGRGGHKDLGDVLLQLNRQICSRTREIREIMWELVEEEESIGRAWACFQALGDPYYGILHALYVENQLYQTVENEFDGSHKTFEKYRQQGIKLLLNYYESGDSIAEIMRRRQPGNGIKKKKACKKKKGKSGQEYEQISFLDDNTTII